MEELQEMQEDSLPQREMMAEMLHLRFIIVILRKVMAAAEEQAQPVNKAHPQHQEPEELAQQQQFYQLQMQHRNPLEK